eukprot:5428410-Pyramimonas_sp.AAC.1
MDYQEWTYDFPKVVGPCFRVVRSRRLAGTAERAAGRAGGTRVHKRAFFAINVSEACTVWYRINGGEYTQ